MNKTLLTLAGVEAVGLSANAAVTLYMTDRAGDFGTLDPATGKYNIIKAEWPTQLAGLAYYNNALYTATFWNGNTQLYQVNPANGDLSAIGVGQHINLWGLGSTTAGVYGFDSAGEVWKFNLTTGNMTDGGGAGSAISITAR